MGQPTSPQEKETKGQLLLAHKELSYTQLNKAVLINQNCPYLQICQNQEMEIQTPKKDFGCWVELF